MTIERLEEIERELNDPNWNISPAVQGWLRELIDECKRLRSELNKISGQAKEAING